MFRQDYASVLSEIRSLCSSRGISPLIPEGGDLTDARDIYEKNIAMIREADGVIANLDPFRGVIEPDSGTVYEIGFARALGKWVVARLSDARAYREKLSETPLAPPDGGSFDADGTSVEDFGLPLNLMAYFASDRIAGSLAEALDEAVKLQAGTIPQAPSRTPVGGGLGEVAGRRG